MRRGVGIGSLQKQNQIKEEYKKKGDEIESLQLAQLNERLAFFKQNLEEFASKHKKDINKDPEFRHQFQQMCAKIGVDPLACSLKHPKEKRKKSRKIKKNKQQN